MHHMPLGTGARRRCASKSGSPIIWTERKWAGVYQPTEFILAGGTGVDAQGGKPDRYRSCAGWRRLDCDLPDRRQPWANHPAAAILFRTPKPDPEPECDPV